MNINESNKPKLKRVNFICEAENLARIEALALKRQTNVSHLMRDAIGQYLSKEEASAR